MAAQRVVLETLSGIALRRSGRAGPARAPLGFGASPRGRSHDMNDSDVLNRIDELVAEEHRLYDKEGSGDFEPSDRVRLGRDRRRARPLLGSPAPAARAARVRPGSRRGAGAQRRHGGALPAVRTLRHTLRGARPCPHGRPRPHRARVLSSARPRPARRRADHRLRARGRPTPTGATGRSWSSFRAARASRRRARPATRPRPFWLDRALTEFRVLMLDQRGTGRSTPVGALSGQDPAGAGRLPEALPRRLDRARRRVDPPRAAASSAGASSGRASAASAR